VARKKRAIGGNGKRHCMMAGAERNAKRLILWISELFCCDEDNWIGRADARRPFLPPIVSAVTLENPADRSSAVEREKLTASRIA
jgi:hypothetical protein